MQFSLTVCLFISVLLLKTHFSRREGCNPLTGLNPPHFCACPKPGPGFQLTNGLVCVQWYDVSSYSLSWYWFE